ncbi:MAG TPA: glycoside hydrolase family 127 protein [Kiritimatiellia bacterium]|nr:glycoside hydrolase family 127 protein [Kiritimatiellia bacterium]
MMKRVFGMWNETGLGSVRAEGWLREALERQRDGLTGHLEVAGYPFNTKGWRAEEIPLGERGGTGWWPFEQVAYWVDGMLRCGLLIGDEGLKAKARRQVDHVMSRPDEEGYLGPRALKRIQGERGSERWPHTVFFRAVMADGEERGGKQGMRRLIGHYLSGTAEHVATRNVCNVEIMAWLYERTGDARMRDLAVACYEAFQKAEAKSGATVKHMLSGRRAKDHGPTYMELFKLGAVMYRITGNKVYLKAAVNAQRKLERDHVLIDGVPSTTEHLRGIYSEAGHETCVITDYVWALGYLLMATGDARYAEAMEKVVYNALPGAVTEDFKALQYFSGPNQVVAGPQTNHHPHGKGCAHVSFRPNPATECCPGNVHRALPCFVGRMWLVDGKGGLVAACYGPGRIEHRVGGKRMNVRQETTYPFGNQVTFHFEGRAPVAFRFGLRIPSWSVHTTLRLNGRNLARKLVRGEFVYVKRTFKPGDVLEVHFEREVVAVKGPEDGVGFLYGPLVLALRVEAKRSVVPEDPRSTEAFPAWTMEPGSPWNFGVALRPGKIPGRAGVMIEELGLVGNPWDAATCPLRVRIPARRIPGWRLIRKKKLVLKWGDHVRIREGDLRFMPGLPDKEARAKAKKSEEWIELVPYGATRLRVTWFPRLPGS